MVGFWEYVMCLIDVVIFNYCFIWWFLILIYFLFVFVGENGVGKFNFYKFLLLLCDVVVGWIMCMIVEEGGLNLVCWFGVCKCGEDGWLCLLVRFGCFKYFVEIGYFSLVVVVFVGELMIKEESIEVV